MRRPRGGAAEPSGAISKAVVAVGGGGALEASSLRAISTLISVSFPADDALQKPEISKNLDHRSTTYRDLIGDGSDAPGCVRRSRADALVPLGAISTPVVSTGTTPPPEPKFGILTKTGIGGTSCA